MIKLSKIIVIFIGICSISYATGMGFITHGMQGASSKDGKKVPIKNGTAIMNKKTF